MKAKTYYRILLLLQWPIVIDIVVHIFSGDLSRVTSSGIILACLLLEKGVVLKEVDMELGGDWDGFPIHRKE